MTRPTFDVLKEPWIPVIRLDGSSDEVGILACLEKAHEIREIKDPSPIVEFGLYRLLVAFILDALIMADQRPEVVSDLRRLLGDGTFDMGLIRDYVAVCGDVFDLFHPERPFLQTNMLGEAAKPLAGLFPAVPSGTNVSHWHHGPEAAWGVGPGEAARLLTTIAPFMTSGGAGLSPSINGAPGVYVLPLGRNLFETLVLNIPLRTEQDSGNGVPAWRATVPPGQERVGSTMVEALTWRPRRVQLVAESLDGGSVRVCQMRFAKGDSTRFPWIDPNLAYRYQKEHATPVRMRENRPLWRDAGPFFLLHDVEVGQGESRVFFKRPDVVDQAFSVGIDCIPTQIQAYGMRTDLKMKIFEWAQAAWRVPYNLGRFTRLGSIVNEELSRADRVAWALRGAVRSLCPRDATGNTDALRCVAGRAERAYWIGLEMEFPFLMAAFASLNPNAPDDPALIAQAASGWREALKNLAVRQFDFAAKDMDADADALERLVKARAWLDSTIRKVLS